MLARLFIVGVYVGWVAPRGTKSTDALRAELERTLGIGIGLWIGDKPGELPPSKRENSNTEEYFSVSRKSGLATSPA